MTTKAIGLLALVNRAGDLEDPSNMGTFEHAQFMGYLEKLASGATVAVGRGTWTHLGKRPLPRGHMAVITGQPAEVLKDVGIHGGSLRNTSIVESPYEAILSSMQDVWFLGGPRLLRAVEPYCHRLRLVYTEATLGARTMEGLLDVQALETRGYHWEHTGGVALFCVGHFRSLPERRL